jgi:hypothetical protein
MKSKTTLALSTAAMAALALLFAAGPVVGTQQALAYQHGGSGSHHDWGSHRPWWHPRLWWHRHWR